MEEGRLLMVTGELIEVEVSSFRGGEGVEDA
jgi:hypothetical protein